jgi:hypothetical protein
MAEMTAKELISKLIDAVEEDGNLIVRVVDKDGYTYTLDSVFVDGSWGSGPKTMLRVVQR